MGLPALVVVAQELLDNKTWVLPDLSLFTTDFSDVIQSEGTAVTIGGLTPSSATKYSSVANFTGVAASAFSGVATLDIMKQTRQFSIGDYKSLSSTAFVNAFATCANEVASGIVREALNLVTSTNFSTNAYSGSTWSYDTVYNSGLAAIPTASVGVLAVTPFLKVRQDVKDFQIYGDSTLMRNKGQSVNIGGVNWCMTTALPTGDGAGHSLDGVILKKSAIGLATRTTFEAGALAASYGMEVANVTDPDTNLTIQLRRWIDPSLGTVYLGASCAYGVAFGGGTAQGALYIH